MYMKERFGAWQTDKNAEHGSVRFKIFFPDRGVDPDQYDSDGKQSSSYGDPRITGIQVVGDFQARLGQQPWDTATAPHLSRETHPHGWQWVCTTPELPAGFYEYKYFVTFQNGGTRWVGDPCCRYGGRRHQNAGVVVGGTYLSVPELPAAQRKSVRDWVQYELHIDDFTCGYRGAEAPIKAIIDKLPYLGDLGVNAVAIMPWTAWQGEDYSWGYTPYLYFSVEQYYTEHLNASDDPQPLPVPSAERLVWLKRLIIECHRLGMHVVMDGVFNHVGCADFDLQRTAGDGFPYPWMYQDPGDCPYLGRYGGSFANLKDLDYHNACTQQFIRDVCLHWIDEFKIDGIRLDNTTNFYVKDDLDHGLPRLIADINAHTSRLGYQPFGLILEHLDDSAAEVTKLTGATSYWNNALYQCCSDTLWNGGIDGRLLRALNTHAALPPGNVATTYISNHDHSHAAWQAGARQNLGSMQWFRIQPWLIALFTAPGSPLIQSGTEFGQDFWIPENDEGTGRRIRLRPLQWEMTADRIGACLLGLHRKLIAIRHAHAGLRSDNFFPGPEAMDCLCFTPEGYGVHAGKSVLIYHRWGQGADGDLERFIVVLNFSASDQPVDIPFPDNGDWLDLLNDRSDQVRDYQLADQSIGSNWGRIYLRKG